MNRTKTVITTTLIEDEQPRTVTEVSPYCATCEEYGLDTWRSFLHDTSADDCGCANPEEHHDPN